jgi:hypothetical protein
MQYITMQQVTVGGPIYNPMLAGQTNPLGRIRIVVSYKMDTSMVMLLHTKYSF